MGQPSLDIDLGRIRDNARLILGLCRDNGIEPTAVVKGFNALAPVVDVIARAGYGTIASSRLPHLRRVRERRLPVRTMALRIPMPSEAAEVVEVCDISLNSEIDTVGRLDAAAARRGAVHAVVWMRDVGDLREGVFDSDRFVRDAVHIEKTFRHIHLLGVGTSLTCYGTVRPSVVNLGDLVDSASAVEAAIGRKLEMVSGGSSSSVPLLVRGKMPKGITNLRLGAVLMYHTLSLAEDELPELRDAFRVNIEVIEAAVKPTVPRGELAYDCFGNGKVFEDRGERRRVILGVGAFDLGDCLKLRTLDAGARVLGASSDHLIVDVHDSDREYRPGDVMSFLMSYQSILTATANEFVHKRFHPGSSGGE